ncbi:MAG: hypothetical protein DRO11_06555 [Methanobacteriota archaeon]|nr:MAG: hypothetical protein DRO11_06555 [Euryarchaeota archaeon]
MRIIPIAAESLGTRSLAVFVETGDVNILLDPGAALGPLRYGLPPTTRETERLIQARQEILRYSEQADIVTISHYHYDHHTPYLTGLYNSTTPEIASEIYKNKIVHLKNPETTNWNQKRRYLALRENLAEDAKKIVISDGKTFVYGNTRLVFSPPLPHGPEDTKLGKILITTVQTPEHTFSHAPDVQGPMLWETTNYILSQKPSTLVLGGPPTYLLGYTIDLNIIKQAIKQLQHLARNISVTIVDHHLLRDKDYATYLARVAQEARKHGHQIHCMATYMGKEPELLEAHRKELSKATRQNKKLGEAPPG